LETVIATASLDFENPHQLRELSGDLGRHLKIVSRELQVRIDQRGGAITVTGTIADTAADLLEQLYELVGTGFSLRPQIVEQACRIALKDPEARVARFFTDTVFVTRKKGQIFPRTANQALYVDAIREHDVVFGIGPAGTGKSYLAVAMAVAALGDNVVERIILCRPAVEAGEKLGFLPGDLVEKVDPYLRPLYDALTDMLGQERLERLLERGIIEVAPLAFMRGRTLANAFVILDEAQNTTSAQMKMFLTRLGPNSRAVVTGDVSQIDLPRGATSGLVQAQELLGDIRGIKFVGFDHTDVVRHRLVAAIIRAYDGKTPRSSS
jgi:phosphate starvation-inducible protein PhoH and related proteins